MILSNLPERRKLKLVKYNKNIQYKLDINLLNYKLFGDKYIIYSTKRIGKEYSEYNDELLFKGEYINGVKNGKGIEYKEGKLVIFEGEYIKGKRNGKGKEYNNGKLIFEGEYLNGKKWNGKSKEYYVNGELRFEGEYLNGKKWNGKIYESKSKLILLDKFSKFQNRKDKKENKEIYNVVYQLKEGKGFIKEYNGEGGLIFEGEYLNGERNGNGKEYYDSGKLLFEGEYLNDKKWNGKIYEKDN